MGSVEPSSLRRDILERTHILEEILDHVDGYSHEFDKVDFSALKEEVLKPIIAEKFDPETQIRGFLRTFKHTLAYKAAFSKIPSQELRQQIDDFIDGQNAKAILDGKGFQLHSYKSPPVVHHFSLLEELKRLLVGGLDVKAAIKDAFHPKHKHVKALPILYEDAGKTQVVEVCPAFPPITLLSNLILVL